MVAVRHRQLKHGSKVVVVPGVAAGVGVRASQVSVAVLEEKRTSETSAMTSCAEWMRKGNERRSIIVGGDGTTARVITSASAVSSDSAVPKSTLRIMESHRAPLFLRLLPNALRGHAETVLPAFFRTGPNVLYRRECLIVPDGGCITLDWPVDVTDSESQPLAIILPGLAGGSSDAYVRSFVVSAAKAGFTPVVFNARGCADSPVTTPQFYSASYTGDARLVVRTLRERFGQRKKIFAAGWSLGANILVNYLAEEGNASTLTSAASIGNPFNLTMCSSNLAQPGIYRVYDTKLASSLRKIFSKHIALFRDDRTIDMDLATRAQTVRDFDEAITAPSFGHKNADAYYANSCSANVIHKVDTRLLCIQAANDPISLEAAIPFDDIEENPRTDLILTEGGGHIGWLCSESGGWLGMEGTLIDRLVLDHWKQILEAKDE